MRDVAPVDEHTAVFRHQQPKNQFESCRFASAGFTNDCNGFSLPYYERNVLENRPIECQTEILELYDRGFLGGAVGFAVAPLLARVCRQLLADGGAHRGA